MKINVEINVKVNVKVKCASGGPAQRADGSGGRVAVGKWAGFFGGGWRPVGVLSSPGT
jgi:hypothetical protein